MCLWCTFSKTQFYRKICFKLFSVLALEGSREQVAYFYLYCKREALLLDWNCCKYIILPVTDGYRVKHMPYDSGRKNPLLARFEIPGFLAHEPQQCCLIDKLLVFEHAEHQYRVYSFSIISHCRAVWRIRLCSFRTTSKWLITYLLKPTMGFDRSISLYKSAYFPWNCQFSHAIYLHSNAPTRKLWHAVGR